MSYYIIELLNFKYDTIIVLFYPLPSESTLHSYNIYQIQKYKRYLAYKLLKKWLKM